MTQATDPASRPECNKESMTMNEGPNTTVIAKVKPETNPRCRPPFTRKGYDCGNMR